MPRKNTTLRLDVDAVIAFRVLAKKSNMSFPRYLEALMVRHAKASGVLDDGYEPIGETRGGDRTQSQAEDKAND